MRRLLVATLLAMFVLGHPVQGRAHSERTQAEEAGLALGAAVLNLFYVPVKGVIAIGGLFLGGFTGMMTGGNTHDAYALWVPAATGTVLLTSGHLDNSEPVELFGTDYNDEPSGYEVGGAIYDAQYQYISR